MPAMTSSWPGTCMVASWSPASIETDCFRERSLSLLLLERSLWFDTAGSESRSQRSLADSLEVPSRGCAVPCLTGTDHGVTAPRLGRIRASLVSVACLLRSLPLFFCATPKTPLRVLCIIALDTVHVLRNARPLPRKRSGELATFLDFQACTNAVWDGKELCAAEYRALRQRLEQAGLRMWIEEYVCQLRALEIRRPSIGGDHRRFDEVRLYREAVARLSLAAITAIALNAECLEDGIRATHCDGDVAALFRMAMQCQIIDDVIDYRKDLSAGLPSFLTASASLPQAMALTADAARSYAASSGRSAGGGCLPAASGALCRHGGDEARCWCCSKREVGRLYGLLDAASATRGDDNVVEFSGDAL